jgi:flagellar motor switch protein FliG
VTAPATIRLSGPQKAAALVLALGEEQAAALVGKLHGDEVRDLSAAMASLGPVPAAAVEEVCREFGEALGRAGHLFGSLESTERLLLKVLPRDRVEQIMEEIRGPAGRTMWEKLGNVHESVLANYLKNEYPQTVAVVLSKVKPGHAARVLALLPRASPWRSSCGCSAWKPSRRRRWTAWSAPSRADFMSSLARSRGRDAHEAMAEIFNNLDRHAEQRLLAALEERDRADADRVRGLMFTFEDLHRVDGPASRRCCARWRRTRLALALKGASEGLRELFFRNLTERASKLLRDDIAALGPVRLRDVDEAQAAIVLLAKDMAAQGQLTLKDAREEEMLQ